jgi:hypothetical protein
MLFISPRTVEYHLHKVSRSSVSARAESSEGAPGRGGRCRARVARQTSTVACGAVLPATRVTRRRVMTRAQLAGTLAGCVNQQVNQEQPGTITGSCCILIHEIV